MLITLSAFKLGSFPGHKGGEKAAWEQGHILSISKKSVGGLLSILLHVVSFLGQYQKVA